MQEVYDVSARTISVKSEDCDLMASIAEEGPRHSWASYITGHNIARNDILNMIPAHRFLIRYPLDKIPPGQRITNAEWSFLVGSVTTNSRLFVWRLLVDWGPGVNYFYRRLRPTPILWSVPGAQGSATDRAMRPTAIVTIQQQGEQTVNVTEDVELWYTGNAPNYGWLLSMEDATSYFRAPSPQNTKKVHWELRITYEPQ